ncbi:MAG: hypothetical protein EP344_19820 [Bacteroidetes bacterium]|nr:MAG: hypothetical protein EP344_19820 [Bacteroidota bacterium]
MISKHWLRTLLLLLVAGSFYPACRKASLEEADIADHTAEFAFPLLQTTLNLKDLMFTVLNDSLSSDTIVVNPDNTMTLYYSGDVAEKPATDIFEFFKFPDAPIPVPDTFYKFPIDVPDSVYVHRADVKSGILTVVLNNGFDEPVHGTFHIPQMSKNGQSFSYDFNVPGKQFALSPGFDLTGYQLLSDSNTLEFRYEAYLPDGSRVVLPEISPGIAGVGILLNGFTLSYVEGYWGFAEYPLTLDTIDIDINQTNLKGNIQVKDPKVTMTVANSWGFPTRGVVKYLSFIGKDGQEYKLESTVFNGDSIDFEYPSLVAGEVGQTKYTHIVLDGTNSNIGTIFNAQPTQLIYEVAGISNAKLDPTIVGFLTDESTIALRMSVELVLEGSAQDFGAEQTLDLNFGGFSDLDTDNIEEVEFKVVTENQTPISTSLQLYFQDEDANTIDSLFLGDPQFIMQAAPVDANGNSIGQQRTETFVPMDVARFERVREAKKMYLKTFFTTADGGTVPVKLLATQNATVKLGLKIKTRF